LVRLFRVDAVNVDFRVTREPRRPPPSRNAERAVTALYQARALDMIRIALLMLGDRAAAEDVVQDAFFGMYRRWRQLREPDKAEAYLRSAVFNGCRDVLRRQALHSRRDWIAAVDLGEPPSAEAMVLFSEDRRRLLTGLSRLPVRQREALVCRFYLELSEKETAQAMHVTQGTVKSTTSRAVAALGRMYREGSC
jgi:RNA polymerase sigma-70 factor (sigma-E family)